MLQIYAQIERLARADIPVLIIGETGCGKELVAAALHAGSPRAHLSMIPLNCAALHEHLAESELFGHERGAFTGAAHTRAGLIEAANGSTLFLDEVGELSPVTQGKLLRVLESGRLTRVGDVHERAVDVRIIAATNRDLRAEVASGRFRSDLFFRLSGALLEIPPLRQRPSEITILASTFLDRARRAIGGAPMTISPEALLVLRAHAWPGNVRAAQERDAVLRHDAGGRRPAPTRRGGGAGLAPDHDGPSFRDQGCAARCAGRSPVSSSVR